MTPRQERRRNCTTPEIDLRDVPFGADAATDLSRAVSRAADPARIRALAFAASLGPSRSPRSKTEHEANELVIDLAGEEALLGYLARLAG
jgi:hypothetical protein